MMAQGAAAQAIIDDDDGFAKAFADIAALGEQPVPDDATTPVDPSVKTSDVAKNAAEVVKEPVKDPDEKAAAAAAGGTETTKTPEELAAEAAAADANAVAAKASQDRIEEELLRRLAGAVKREPPQVEQPPARQQEQVQQNYNEEEVDFLMGYAKDFGTVARAEALIRRQEYNMLTTHIFREISQRILPLTQTVREMAERMHLGDLQTEVPTYSIASRDAALAWIAKQPPYLQEAYGRVVKSGTVQEVGDLMNRFQKDTGFVAPSNSGKGAVTELPAAAKKAAAALAQVSSKRSSAAVVEDPSNFDAAFAIAAAVKDV